MQHLYIERWNSVLAHEDKPWVVFAHGTCVVLMEPEPDVAQQARTLIARWPVAAGSELGDFSVVTLTDVPGWVITCAHPDILTYLAPEEVVNEAASELAIGLQGRAKRDQDAREQQIILIRSST